MEEKKLKRGEAKIQFFTNFDYIKSKYEAGQVVATVLYKLTKKEKDITMTYQQFNNYFKKYILEKDERFFYSGAKEKKETATAKELEQNEEPSPKIFETPKVKKIIIGGAKEKKSFNPHTRNINKEDIL